MDTNILIEYIWRTYYPKTEVGTTPACQLIERGVEVNYEMYISYYTLMEISQHFTDYYLEQKAIRNGFSYREFPRMRGDFTLSEDETEAISELIEILRKNEFLNYIDVGEIKGDLFKIIMRYVQGYLDFIDALHVRTAIDVGCEYFVTKDGELRKRVQRLIEKKVITEPIKIATASGFLNILEKGN